MFNNRKCGMNLSPGQSILLTKTQSARVDVERSGDGKTIRYVRTFPNGSWEVFKTERVA